MNQRHKHADLIIAWANGAIIQFKSRHGVWGNVLQNKPSWSIDTEYRIKEEPQYVPFKKGDAYSLVGKIVKRKTSAIVNLISAADESSIFCGKTWYNLEELFEQFTFADGSPCGELSS